MRWTDAFWSHMLQEDVEPTAYAPGKDVSDIFDLLFSSCVITAMCYPLQISTDTHFQLSYTTYFVPHCRHTSMIPTFNYALVHRN